MPAPLVGVNSIPVAIFLADIARLQARLPDVLAEEDRAQAGDIARRARARGASLGSVHAKAAPGIKAVNQAPIVRLFGDEHPYIFGAEFGGGARPTTRQFPPWRGKGNSAGYMLYPTIRERLSKEEDFEGRYADAIEDLAKFH